MSTRSPMEDFSNWTNSNHLLYLTTVGASFTWDNGRKGPDHTQKWLDIAICNQDWADTCVFTSCSTLVKTRFDQYPLLLHFKSDNTNFKY